jgi:anthranilate synthase
VAKEGGAGVATASQQAAQQNLSLGAPPARPKSGEYVTLGGIQVTTQVDRLEFSDVIRDGTSAWAIEELVRKLDARKGVLLQSSYEFPGRYARWSLGFVDPPLQVTGRGSNCSIKALNNRGKVLMKAIEENMNQLKDNGILESVRVAYDEPNGSKQGLERHAREIDVVVIPPPEVGTFSEENRSRQPSLFSVVRALIDLFSYQEGDRQLGLYGAFGYDLTFQFESINLKQERDQEQRDLVLYLPDRIIVVDQDKRDAWRMSYDFSVNQLSTQGLSCDGTEELFQPFDESTMTYNPRDTPKHEFASSVDKAKQEFAVGNLFEAVLSQTFREKLREDVAPSVMFRRLRARNPAPYGFFINLGEQEYLVGASPEMFVRCEAIQDNDYRAGAIRVETCPISGTVARGADALEDAARVKSLMMNAKEESELTMCTDVDRNDKSRICEPGSVQVIGRRQIEMYSRLIHTVDHVEGYLRPEFDALDAFLCHTWAVTVTGAPKTWAIQFVEDTERSPRCWYGGAVGMVGFDGGMNTGLTLRTIRIKNGVAEVRAGATLLYDSNPLAEELETELKASAMMDAIVREGPEDNGEIQPKLKKTDMKIGSGMSLILIDHEDSFVHTLGNYLRQTGATVRTLRSGPSALKVLDDLVAKGEKPDLVVLSPGPGNPSDFGLSSTIDCVTKHEIPAFGVCLGLQGMVEHFGGTLGILSYPMHGKPSMISLTRAGKTAGSIFTSLPDSFEVARYHSLHGLRDCMPDCFEVTAQTEDGIVMAIQHKELPMAAVQFHPESILTSPSHGMTILINALTYLKNRDLKAVDQRKSGAQLVAELESLTVDQLTDQLQSAGLSTTGTTSELVVRLALWKHKASELQAGRVALEEMSENSLRELMSGMGLKKSAPTKEGIIEILQDCLSTPL